MVLQDQKSTEIIISPLADKVAIHNVQSGAAGCYIPEYGQFDVAACLLCSMMVMDWLSISLDRICKRIP